MSGVIDLVSVLGQHVQITEDAAGVLTYQPFQPDGEPTFFHQTLSQGGALAFAAVPTSFGGFEVIWIQQVTDASGAHTTRLLGQAITEEGRIDPSFDINVPLGNQIAPQLMALDGGRFLLGYDVVDEATGIPTAHIRLGQSGFLYSDTTLQNGLPERIVVSAGTIELELGDGARQVLDHAGNPLTVAGASTIYELPVDGDQTTVLPRFNADHDQIRLFNSSDHSTAGGLHSTLTYDLRAGGLLSWDPDSEGPAPIRPIARMGFAGVQNLAADFRPAVLKVIAGDGSQTITWFDTDGSQSWDTLQATEDPSGRLLTYGSVSDGGTQEVFHFDVDNSQPYQRYVDDLDLQGHVANRAVLYDDGSSWSARFVYSAGQVAFYELTSFDAQGNQVSHGYFDPNGIPI